VVSLLGVRLGVSPVPLLPQESRISVPINIFINYLLKENLYKNRNSLEKSL
jgi:hypothetical protein